MRLKADGTGARHRVWLNGRDVSMRAFDVVWFLGLGAVRMYDVDEDGYILWVYDVLSGASYSPARWHFGIIKVRPVR